MSMYAALRLHPRATESLEALCRTVIVESAPGLRYAPPDDWHITLAFFGKVSESRMPTLHGLLQCAAVDFGPIPLSLNGVGHFDAPVLWAGVKGDTDRLTELAETLRFTAGGDTTYPFTPHVTLGKDPENIALLDGLVAKVGTYKGPLWVADRIHLMRSYSGPGGGADESVASWPLEGLR